MCAHPSCAHILKILQSHCNSDALKMYLFLLRIKKANEAERKREKETERERTQCKYCIHSNNTCKRAENWQHFAGIRNWKDERLHICESNNKSNGNGPYLPPGNRKSANKLPNICDELIELKFSNFTLSTKSIFFVRYCENICFVFGKTKLLCCRIEFRC